MSDRHTQAEVHHYDPETGATTPTGETVDFTSVERQAEWLGVYPGMCVDPETCRGYSHCPRDYSCSE